MAVAAAVVGAVSGVVGAVGAVRSAKAQRQVQAAQQRQQTLSTQRSRRQAIRQAQIARAGAVSAGANLGGLFGSSLQGGLTSASSQLGGGLGFSSQMSGLSANINTAQRSAARWGTISQLGFGLFNALGGLSNASNAFSFGESSSGVTSPAAAGSTYRPQPNPSYSPSSSPSRSAPSGSWTMPAGIYGAQ